MRGVRVVGWGLFPIPGEKRRHRKALEEVDRENEIIRIIERRSGMGETRTIPEDEFLAGESLCALYKTDEYQRLLLYVHINGQDKSKSHEENMDKAHLRSMILVQKDLARNIAGFSD